MTATTSPTWTVSDWKVGCHPYDDEKAAVDDEKQYGHDGFHQPECINCVIPQSSCNFLEFFRLEQSAVIGFDQPDSFEVLLDGTVDLVQTFLYTQEYFTPFGRHDDQEQEKYRCQE